MWFFDIFPKFTEKKTNNSTFVHVFLFFIKKYHKFANTKSEAIHNKDYSVVKTFKVGAIIRSRFFLYMYNNMLCDNLLEEGSEHGLHGFARIFC